MNFQANRKEWQLGDLVVHDKDAKEHRMIRIVIGFKHGLIRTVYAFKTELPMSWRRAVFLDYPKHLHNPKRFYISMGGAA